ncbi:MAG TPA: hypothetical protein VK173_11745 [Lacibacter sp.]|nr:hypothetical protein [Lacibacter sp.]
MQPGESVLDIIPKSEMYEYPQFEQGVVNFKNGKRSVAKLNYNFVHEEILFITAQGDTLTIINPEEVKNVVIGSTEFFYSPGRFVKLDTTIGEIKLTTAGFFSTISKRRIGAYGTTTDGGSDSYGSYIVPNNTKLELTPNVVTTVAYSKALFIGNKFNQFIPVTKKNIFSFYPEKEAQLKKYFQTKEVNFSSREDIIALVAYMALL